VTPTPATGGGASLAGFRAGYWFGGFNGLTWMIGLGTPMVLLTEQLGGSTFQVGLATSFVVLLFPVQVVATALLPRLGFRRQMVLAWSARATFLSIPLSLVWLAPATPADWMASAVVASVFGFCVFRAFGVAAHIAWFAAILPDGLRGRFFATDNAITSVVGVVTLLSCAFLFDRLPTYTAFRTVYFVAVAGSALAVWNLLRLPVGPVPPESPLGRMLGETLTLARRPGLFRHYLWVSLLWLFATIPIPGFAAYYLKVETDVASSQILAYTAVQFIGQIIGATSIRRLIGGIPMRRIFQFANAFAILVCLAWLTVLSDGPRWASILWIAYALFGIAIGLSQAAHFTYLPELAAPEKRPVTIAIFGAITGMLSGLAPMLWGLVLRTEGNVRGVDLASFSIFFCVGIVLSLAGMLLLQKLPDSRSGRVR
jgi:hypothetical protein